MKMLLTFVALCLCLSAVAQHKLQAEGSLLLITGSFTGDSLVPPKRQQATSFGGEKQVQLVYHRSVGQRLWLNAGIGYAERKFKMNKTNLIDMFFLALVLAPRIGDTFYLRQVQISNHYLTLPVGFAWRLSKADRNVSAFAGLQLRPAFLTSARSRSHFDSSYHIPTAAEKYEVEKLYASTAESFLMSVHPKFQMAVDLGSRLALSLDLQPFHFYFNSSNKKLIKRSGGFGLTAGFLFKLE